MWLGLGDGRGMGWWASRPPNDGPEPAGSCRLWVKSFGLCSEHSLESHVGVLIKESEFVFLEESGFCVETMYGVRVGAERPAGGSEVAKVAWGGLD